MENEMTSTPHDGVGHPNGARPDPGKVLFVGSSPRLDALRARARDRQCPIAEEPEVDVRLVIADEDVLDGLCTAEQSALIAASRALGLTCVPPDLVSTWWGEPAVPETVDGTAVLRADPHAEVTVTPMGTT